eukprot:1480069-Alexandrium_andersonii.AAC.1
MRALCHNVCAVQNARARPRAVTLTRRRVTESLSTLGDLKHVMACSRTLADHVPHMKCRTYLFSPLAGFVLR